ncbi:hypothetical protein CISIN_1g031187mg [Citrus sinensis]|uniref:Uncharacterized protein n=1 Tax=Citrus sinensis TaxID=2711 RepID=A0A067DKW7_CITSI|nr:hypothetical protein CISIN_1g031187mg [Citrus sinensis]
MIPSNLFSSIKSLISIVKLPREDGINPENLLPFNSNPSNLLSLPITSGTLPLKLLPSNPRRLKLTRFPIPTGMFPCIRLSPIVRIRKWAERFAMEIGISPPKPFWARPNTSRLVQLAKNLRKCKSPISLLPSSFSSKFSLTRSFKLPKFSGILPVRPFSAKSRT